MIWLGLFLFDLAALLAFWLFVVGGPIWMPIAIAVLFTMLARVAAA